MVFGLETSYSTGNCSTNVPSSVTLPRLPSESFAFREKSANHRQPRQRLVSARGIMLYTDINNTPRMIKLSFFGDFFNNTRLHPHGKAGLKGTSCVRRHQIYNCPEGAFCVRDPYSYRHASKNRCVFVWSNLSILSIFDQICLFCHNLIQKYF